MDLHVRGNAALVDKFRLHFKPRFQGRANPLCSSSLSTSERHVQLAGWARQGIFFARPSCSPELHDGFARPWKRSFNRLEVAWEMKQISSVKKRVFWGCEARPGGWRSPGSWERSTPGGISPLWGRGARPGGYRLPGGWGRSSPGGRSPRSRSTSGRLEVAWGLGKISSGRKKSTLGSRSTSGRLHQARINFF
jgi:hypothetical protein